MTSVLDAWRAVDPQARLVSGSVDRLSAAVRGAARTRAAPPYLPALAPGQILVADVAVLPEHLDLLVDALREAELEPSAIWIAGPMRGSPDRAGDPIPVIAGGVAPTGVERAISAYLADVPAHLSDLATQLRLSGAEAALAEPRPGAPAGIVAERLHRGVAVTVDGALSALTPRAAGRALATRFAAAHERLLATRAGPTAAARRTRDGLWILERPLGEKAAAWLFDDLPFARVDEAALEALAITLRALLRRRPAEPARARRAPRLPPSTGDPMRDTLVAVARANGRVAPAARTLGVHRNTVLYRLRQASDRLGIDPRRPDDALRLLREVDRRP